MENVEKVLLLKERIFRKKLSKNEASFIRNVYLEKFNIRLRTGCGTCLVEAYFELKSLTKEKIITMKNRAFKIKDGEVLSMHGVSESYNNSNLTNRAALTMLKLNRGCIKFFTEFPKNWVELSEKFDLRMTEDQANELVLGSKSVAKDLPVQPKMISESKTSSEAKKNNFKK